MHKYTRSRPNTFYSNSFQHLIGQVHSISISISISIFYFCSATKKTERNKQTYRTIAEEEKGRSIGARSGDERAIAPSKFLKFEKIRIFRAIFGKR